MEVGSSIDHTLTYRNLSAKPIDFAFGMAIAQHDDGSAAVVDDGCLFTTLAPGGSCDVTFRWSPTAPGFNSGIVINFSSPGIQTGWQGTAVSP